MLFDKFCKFVENDIPDIANQINNAGLFVFDEKIMEDFLKSIDENIEDLNKTFFLPFQTIIIENPTILVIFSDDIQLPGIFCKRKYIDFTKVFIDDLQFTEDIMERMINNITDSSYSKIRHKVNIRDSYIITFGDVILRHQNNNCLHITNNITKCLFASKKNVFCSIVNDNAVENLVTKNLMVGIKEVMFINSPNYFIVEESPVKTAKKINKNKIARSHQRPKYTVLKPNKIHKLFKYTPEEITENSNKKSPTPHLRRRHIRTFRSDRYINAKDKQIIIPATWIGPTEYYDGFKKYRVCLEK